VATQPKKARAIKRGFKMTSFSYNLTLEETEVITVKAALELMIERCDKNIAKGEKAPNWARKDAAESVLSRLHDNATQISGNNFW